MSRHVRWAAAALTGVLVLAIVMWRVGWRCGEQPLPNGYRGELCYSWFQPHLLVVSEPQGHPFFYAVLRGRLRDHLPASQEFVDLFGSGRISGFASTSPSRDPAGGWTKTVEIATKDDGRVDLTLEYEGVSHPLAGALKRATMVRPENCSAWKSISDRVAGRSSTRLRCADPSAVRVVDLGRATGELRSLGISERRLGFILWGEGRTHETVGAVRQMPN